MEVNDCDTIVARRDWEKPQVREPVCLLWFQCRNSQIWALKAEAQHSVVKYKMWGKKYLREARMQLSQSFLSLLFWIWIVWILLNWIYVKLTTGPSFITLSLCSEIVIFVIFWQWKRRVWPFIDVFDYLSNRRRFELRWKQECLCMLRRMILLFAVSWRYSLSRRIPDGETVWAEESRMGIQSEQKNPGDSQELTTEWSPRKIIWGKYDNAWLPSELI
jgi:hypothetical protein